MFSQSCLCVRGSVFSVVGKRFRLELPSHLSKLSKKQIYLSYQWKSLMFHSMYNVKGPFWQRCIRMKASPQVNCTNYRFGEKKIEIFVQFTCVFFFCKAKGLKFVVFEVYIFFSELSTMKITINIGGSLNFDQILVKFW